MPFTTVLRRLTHLALAGFALLAVADRAHAGAWVVAGSISITRTPAAGGNYDVTISFTVRRSARDVGPAGTITTCVHVQEEDACFDDTIFNGGATINIPAPGGTATTTLTYSYPCSWGNDIEVEIENSGWTFTGASHQVNGLPMLGTPEECHPGTLAGDWTLSPQVLADPSLRAFFSEPQPDPHVPVSRGYSAQDGVALLDVDTEVLPDPRPLGYEFYIVSVRDSIGGAFARLGLRSVGPEVPPGVEPQDFPQFAKPVSLASFSAQDWPIDRFDQGEIVLFDAENAQQPLLVYAGSIAPLPPEVAVRHGSVNTAVGPPYDVLEINGLLGDSSRRVSLNAGGPLTLSIIEYPGQAGQLIDYVVYLLPRENQPGDITPHPFGLGNGSFSTAITGGPSLTLLNTIGRPNLLGQPRIPGTPLGPGTVLQVAQTPASLAGRSLTFQGIVRDSFAPNGQAAFTNAIVVRFQ